MSETKQKKPIYKKWWFWLVVILFIAAIGNFDEEETVDSQATETQADETQEKIDREEEKKQKEEERARQKAEEEKKKQEQAIKDKEDYISSAKTYDYGELERNPDKYKGEVAEFKGKVIQVSESFFSTIYRVNVNYVDEDWQDTIYVSYKREDDEERVLEDDIVTIYGDLDGVETYTSVLAGRVTIPSVKAKYIIIE